MDILVIGGGGREHAFAWKLNQSGQCGKLYVAPGNAGTAQIAQNVPIAVDDFVGLGDFVRDNGVEMVVVGPEAPLVKGIREYFEADPTLRQVALVGPGRQGAMLEGSKDFAKAFMHRHGIPTAQARTFDSSQLADARQYIDTLPTPIVIKADGLAAGKGVAICPDHQQTKDALGAMLVDRKFGTAGDKVLIESFLDGIELSVFVLTDGANYVLLPEAKDYKRIGEGDTGPNTGGMGAISPVAFADETFMDKVRQQIIAPTIAGLRAEGIPYQGFIFIGLMNVDGAPYVIEYNVRMGDPETQAVLARVDTDLVGLLHAAATQALPTTPLPVLADTAATVVMVADGYPGTYAKGMPISGLATEGETMVFHAGTKHAQGETVTNGGRVLAVTGLGATTETALKNAYGRVGKIDWKGAGYRKDIGHDLMPHAARRTDSPQDVE